MGKYKENREEHQRRNKGAVSVSKSLESMSQSKKISTKPLKPSSYIDSTDLPPSSDEEEDNEELENQNQDKQLKPSAKQRNASRAAVDHQPVLGSISEKERSERERKERDAFHAAELAKKEALEEDRDAFEVTFERASNLDGEDDASKANVRDVTVKDLCVSARGNELLFKASLKISHGRRYGLVGPNGSGKSTLLKLLAWRKIPVPQNIDVLLVEQEVVGDDRSALETVVSADEELARAREEIGSLQSDVDHDGDRLSELYDKMRIMGWDATEAQASKILAGLGFDGAMQARATRSFSGGWRMRISLARALFVRPTLLLLDEPTNHLDLRAVLWLEEYLCRWKRTLVVVSHDRDFLNTVCNEIIHLDKERKSLFSCGGDFDAFERAYAQHRKEKANNKEVKKKIEAAKKTGDPALLKRAKKEALKMSGEYTAHFSFPQPTELAQHPLLRLIGAGFRYPGRDDFGLSNVDVGIGMGTRAAIVGPNGAGKSTLLNILTGDLVPTEGATGPRSPKLRIGRYSQHFVDLLTMEENAVQYLLREHPDQEGPSRQEAVRARLGRFGLPSRNHTIPIARLSGGQKARVVFASIAMSRPHILLLDEPTNHLDMQSIDALAGAIDGFEGGVVLVSHDSRLISRVCEEEGEIWDVRDGTVERFEGSFEEYKKKLVDEIKAELG